MATANRLAEILTEQLEILKELQQTLQEEQEAIVKIDTTYMESLNTQKEQIIIRQRKTAERLHSVMAETAIQTGLPPSATLTEIINKMPTQMREQIQPLQQAAKQAGSSVSALANQNRGMLERFLTVVNDSLAFILRILHTSNTYGVRGTYLSNTQAGAVMVNREA